MLSILPDQIKALEVSKLSIFNQKMITHLQTVFPEWASAMDTAELTAFVEHGVHQAKHYGFISEADVARYLHVMKTMGQDFDTSSELPWTAELLTSDLAAGEKMNRLRDAVDYHLQAGRIMHA